MLFKHQELVVRLTCHLKSMQKEIERKGIKHSFQMVP